MPWVFSKLSRLSVGISATSLNLAIGAGSSASWPGTLSAGWPRILLQSPTHSSQMNTLGPAMSFATLSWFLPQNEQWSIGLSPFRRDHGSRDVALLRVLLRVMGSLRVN